MQDAGNHQNQFFLNVPLQVLNYFHIEFEFALQTQWNGGKDPDDDEHWAELVLIRQQKEISRFYSYFLRLYAHIFR